MLLAMAGMMGAVPGSAQDEARGNQGDAGVGKAATVLVDVDHRQNLSLDGDWHVIADPYVAGCTTSISMC